MGFSSKVDNGVNLFTRNNMAHKIHGANVTLHKGKVGLFGDFLEVGSRTAIVELIEAHPTNLGILANKVHKDIGANESCATGHKHALGLVYIR